MKERRTTSILQRLPVILAVTAASYGLPLQAQAHAQRGASSAKTMSRPAAATSERPLHDQRLVRHH